MLRACKTLRAANLLAPTDQSTEGPPQQARLCASCLAELGLNRAYVESLAYLKHCNHFWLFYEGPLDRHKISKICGLPGFTALPSLAEEESRLEAASKLPLRELSDRSHCDV